MACFWFLAVSFEVLILLHAEAIKEANNPSVRQEGAASENKSSSSEENPCVRQTKSSYRSSFGFQILFLVHVQLLTKRSDTNQDYYI